MKSILKFSFIYFVVFTLNFALFCSSSAYADNFTAQTLGDYGNVTVMEVTGNYDERNPDNTINSLPRQTIAKEFFRIHRDEYDFLVIFTNFNFRMRPEAIAFYSQIKNDTQGIGQQVFDNSSFYGSNGKLQGTIDMGNVANLVLDPLDPDFDFTLDTLSHEMMHRWAAYVKFKDPNDNLSSALLGKDNSHWSFLLNTEASLMYGNTWQDNGNGTFTSVKARKYYSPLDLYLMGFIDRSQVPPMLLIDNPEIDPKQSSEEGVTISGTPRYVTIDDIIAAEGNRVPGPSESQKSFRTAFIFITTPGTFTGDELYGLEDIRNSWITRYSVLTDGAGLVQVNSALIDDIPENPGITDPSVTPRNLPPSIEDGVLWLKNIQEPDGSWMDTDETVERDTAEAVLALKTFETAAENYSSGLQWLNSMTPQNTDFISRKAGSINNAGQDISTLVNDLVLKQNPDGGWGNETENFSSVTDTALVLKTLSSAGYSGQTIIQKALEYLKAKQDPDGGWSGDDSGGSIEATAKVLSALNSYQLSNNNYQLTDHISRGMTWLLQRQNSDGGFGPSTSSGQAGISTVYDTALAVLALTELNASKDVLNNGMNYTLSQQSGNGSWHESPYETALAIEAVWKASVDPDLSIKKSDITFIPSAITMLPASVVININISNLGRTDVPQAKVVLYKDAVSNTNKLGEQILAFPGLSTVTVTFATTVTDGNEHSFYISVDPDDLVKEANEGNNTAQNILKPEPTYDLEIQQADITVSENPVDIFNDVKIRAKITNKGTMNAYNVQVKYYIDENGTPFDIATSTVNVPANSTITDEITWRANKAGENLVLTVFADAFDNFTEISETNNKAVKNITVNGAEGINLTISYKDIRIDPSPANQRGNAVISALIRNAGFASASNIRIDFYKGIPGVNGVLLGSQMIPSLNAGESSQVSFEWTDIMDSGEELVYILVDPEDQIKEIREDDNEAFKEITILNLPDLVISTNSILFSPSTPKGGDVVSVKVSVQNKGEQTAGNILVKAFEGDTLIGSQIIPSISGNSKTETSFTYDTTGKTGAHEITVKVDPDNAIIEQNENNNKASRSFGVNSGKLWLSEQYISPNGDGIKDSTEFSFDLDSPQTVKIIVVNNKAETVRTFAGPELSNITSGAVTWDGLDDKSMLVADGQYLIKVLDVMNNAIGSLLVTVDNNRSNLLEAVGTEYLFKVNAGNLLRDDNWQWFPDESGIIFYLSKPNEKFPEYPTGIYRMSLLGDDVIRLVPPEWSIGNDPVYDYRYRTNSSQCQIQWAVRKNYGYSLSNNGQNTAFILEKYNRATNNIEQSQLWIVDSYGEDLLLLESYDLLSGDHIEITDIFWAPDNSYIAYKIYNQTLDQFKFYIIRPDGSGKIEVSTNWSSTNGLNQHLIWLPDSTKIAYTSDNQVVVVDTNGNKSNVFPVKGNDVAIDWFNNNSILVRDFYRNPSTFRYVYDIWIVNILFEEDAINIDENVDRNDGFADETQKCIKTETNSFKLMSCINPQGYFSYWDDDEWGKVEDLSWDVIKVCDVTGNCEIANDVVSGETSGSSPDGKKWVFHDLSYDSLTVYDMNTKETDIVPVGYWVDWWWDMLTDLPASYHVWPIPENLDYFIGFNSLQWLDNRSLLTEYFPLSDDSSLGIYDINNMTIKSLPISDYNSYRWANERLSPHKNYINYYLHDYSSGNILGSRNLWVLGSLFNLTAHIDIIKNKSSITIKGTATDLNFEGYQLEYADVQNPDVWYLISPFTDTSVINDIFTTWVPPYAGTFYIRLTVWDKAGNSAISRNRVSWGLPPPRIANLYKTDEVFSPNGDGVQDTVGLHYTVFTSEPAYFDFYVYDENNYLIKTYTKSYTSTTEDTMTWDGTDEYNNIVPEGKYKIQVFEYEFFFEVDNTPPDVNLELASIYESFKASSGAGIDFIKLYQADMLGLAYDDNLRNWIIEYGEDDNPQEWFIHREGGAILAEKDDKGNLIYPLKNELIHSYPFTIAMDSIGSYVWNEIAELVGKTYKITAEDLGGNKSSFISNMLGENVFLTVTVNKDTCKIQDILVLETIKEQVSTITLQSGKNDIWIDLETISSPSEKETEKPPFNTDGIPPKDLRIKLIDTHSNEYYSNKYSASCNNDDNPGNGVEENNKFKLSIKYDEPGCNLPSNKAILSASLEGFSKTSLRTLSYYIQKAEGLQLLRKFDLTRERWESVTIDSSSMPESSYPVKAVLSYFDLSDNQTKEITASNILNVDRVLPVAQINYPVKSIMLCPVKQADPKGDWFGVPVEGIALDNINVRKWELLYGLGENPAVWLPAITKINSKPASITGGTTVKGQLGIWDVTGQKNNDFSIKLKVTDIAGNTSCTSTSFSIDNLTEIKDITKDRSIFSPNGDNVLDNVTVNYHIEEYANVDVKVFKLIFIGKEYVLDPSPIRTISSDLIHHGGPNSIVWDGKGDNATAMADGRYAIAIYAKDSCENANMKWTSVEIDTTPPTTIITYPRPPDILGNIVEVKGSADDQNFKNYTLEAGQGDNPSAWTLISSSTKPVKDGILGKWNTYELEGKWTLKLSATDKLGNNNSTTVTIDLSSRKNLIKDLGATPGLFSPNNDEKLDTTIIRYELTDTCNITLNILDQSNNIKKTYTTLLTAGMHTYTWDGKDSQGDMVFDGTFRVQLTAELASDISVKQEETITIAVDTTLPVIDIKQPVDISYIKTDVTINGTISDTNIREYTITNITEAGRELVDNADQNREDHTFGILQGLPEGNYTLNIKTSDLAENVLENNINYTIDRTPPQVILDNPKEGEFYGGQQKNEINITGSVIDQNLDIFNLRYGTGDNPTLWTDLLTGNTIPANAKLFSWKVGKDDGVPDGQYTLSLYAKDKAGSEGEAKVKVKIDNTNPETLITQPADNSYVKSPVDIKGTAFDINLDKYTLSLSEGNCTTAFKWAAMKISTSPANDNVIFSWQALPPDGEYCLRLSAGDKTGNNSETKTNIKVDTHPPAAPVLSGEIENRSNVKLTWPANAEPDLNGYNIYRDAKKQNTAIVACCEFIDQNLSGGVYTYTAKAVDLAGNESMASNEVKFTIDKTGPDARIQSPLDNTRISGLVDIKGTAYSADDFKQYKISFGSGIDPLTWTTIRTSPVPATYGLLARWETIGLSEGQYTIKLEAEDISGNINTHQIAVFVDNTPPAAPLLISAVPNISDVGLTWQANTETDLSGYLLYRNNDIANATGIIIGNLKPYVITSTAYLDISLPDGKFIYYLLAMDQAGNMSDPSNSFEVNLDTHPPKSSIIDPADRSKFEHKTLLRAESADLDIASVQFQYKRTEDSAWINIGNIVMQLPFVIHLDPIALGLVYGDYDLRAIATDNGGKTDESPSYITVTYTDLTAPEAPKDLNAMVNGADVSLTWTANTETDLDGYNAYRTNGETKARINTSVIKDLTYSDNNLSDGTYTFEIRAVDTYGNESRPSETATAKIYAPVLIQPYTPTGDQSIQIQGSNAAGQSSIEIFTDIGTSTVSQGTTTADVAGNFTFNITLELGENKITAKAKDNAGNISKTSNMVMIAYNEPPSQPTGFASVINGHDVSLTWDPNIETDLSGYNLYRAEGKINKPVSVSSGTTSASSYYSSSFTSSQARDDNSSTYWMPVYSSGTFAPVWWQIDFSSPELISHLEINWLNDEYSGKDYEVQFWSGYAWITETKTKGNKISKNDIKIKPSYRTDKIRIYITDTNYSETNWKRVGLSEVKILKDNLITDTTYDELDLPDGMHNYRLTAVDYYGSESLPAEKEAPIGDVTPPSAPQNLTATSSGWDVLLNWTANTEPDLSKYKIYHNDGQGWSQIYSWMTLTDTFFTDSYLLNSTYNYRITAVDANGNESLPSNEVTATISVTLPEPPENLTAASLPEGNSLKLTWGAIAPYISGFNLYRSITPGGPYTLLNSWIWTNSYIDTMLTNGIAYYYVVTALDDAGNESPYSNEATGIPSYVSLSSKPVLFFPTITGMPLTLFNNWTDLSGTAEQSSTVNLFKNGDFAGSTTSVSTDSLQSFTMSEDANYFNMCISPDGKLMVYVIAGPPDWIQHIWLKDLATGDEKEIQASAWSCDWSPDSKKVAFTYKENTWNYRIGLYDIDSGNIENLTNDTYSGLPYIYEYYPSWSGDGNHIAFYTYDTNWITGIWMKDIKTGVITKLIDTSKGYNFKISPDGNRLAYTEDQSLYMLDTSTGIPVLIDDKAGWSTLTDWSPDSKKLAFVSYRYDFGDIFTFDVDTLEQLRITDPTLENNYSADNPVWSPDGKRIAFTSDSSTSIWISSINSGMASRVVTHSANGTRWLSWTETGDIAYYSYDGSFNIINLKGNFNFRDIKLDPGENIFYVMATDASGVLSEISDHITVIYDAGILPDLETTPDDIFIYPSYPIAGEDTAVNIIVWNNGLTEAKDVKADVYIWDSTGMLELVKSVNIPIIAPESGEVIGFTWDSTGKEGINRIIVVIDPSDNILEQSETNNYAEKEFVVAEQEGISMSTILNSNTFISNQDMTIDINIINNNPEKNATLDVKIEDENGYPVFSLYSADQHLAYGMTKMHFKWNTGLTYAGSYRVHSHLKEAAGVISENFETFTIQPDINISSTVFSNKTSYGSNENVKIDFKVKSNGLNYIIPELKAKIRITDTSNNLIMTENKDINNLFPGTIVSLSSQWNTALNPPGDYSVHLDVYLNNMDVSNAAALFKIVQASSFSGTINLTPIIVLTGNNIQTDYTVKNTGNTNATSLIVKVMIIDPETQAVMHINEETIDLMMNSGYNGKVFFSTQGYNLKTYQAVLQCSYQNSSQNLSSGSFSVKDGTPPVLKVISPISGSTLNSNIDMSVTATDNASGIDKVEYNIDSSEWKSMPVSDLSSGKYSTTWSPTVSEKGKHVILFRSTDKAGNTSKPIAIEITIDMPEPIEILTGSIKAEPVKVSHGSDETISYSVTNNGQEDIADIKVTMLIIDQGTQEIRQSNTYQHSLKAGETITGINVISTSNLEIKKYDVILQSEKTEIKTLAATTFEVTASFEIQKTVFDNVNLLVWINDGCPHDVIDGYSRNIKIKKKTEYCVRPDILENILGEATSDFFTVYSADDFQTELRNPYYTDLLILGDSNMLSTQHKDEIREKVYSGTGIISALWTRHGKEKDTIGKLEDVVFGIRHKGNINSNNHTIRTVESPITEEGIINVPGTAKIIELIENVTVAAWTENDDNSTSRPAIVLNEYGQGKAVYYAIDLGSISEEEGLSKLISNSIAYIHRPINETSFPGSLLPVQIEASTSTGTFNLILTEVFPEEIKLYDPVTRQQISDSNWSKELHVEPGKAASVRFYAIVPDKLGTYTLFTEIDGADDSYQPLDFNIIVEEDSASMINIIKQEMVNLSQPSNQKAFNKINKHIRLLQEREIASKRNIEANISDILKSIKYLFKLNESDTGTIRSDLDNLLRFEESRFYFY